MRWRDARFCPTCGQNSEVTKKVADFRYRKCLNPNCRLNWRTQECLQGQVDDLTMWYDRQIDEGGPAMQALIDDITRVLRTARRVSDAVGMEEATNGS